MAKTKSEIKRPVGRQTLDDPTVIPIVKACARFGATAEEIASYLGISTSCFYSWQLEHQELQEALKRDANASDERVEKSLYQQALAGNVVACIFWLKNRRKDRWRDVQQIEGALGHYVISERPLTEEEWTKDRATIIDATPTLPKD